MFAVRLPCRCGVRRGACPLCRLSALPLVCFLSPILPTPFPAGRGRPKVYFAGGFAPGTPALNRLRHLQPLPCGHPTQGACGSPQKQQEAVLYGQCRQPRRGGTGGDGTIRRKRRRRLRWSSPPGQGEPVSLGVSPPPGTGAAPQPQQKKQSPEPRTNLPLNNYIREKFLGVWGLLSRSPQRIPNVSLMHP